MDGLCLLLFQSRGTTLSQPRVERRESANVAQPWVGGEYAGKTPKGWP